MVLNDLVLAALLLTTPAGTPESCPPAEQFPALRDSILKVAIEWEILDPRETRYMLTKPEDFCCDLNVLRRRYHELKDAPKVGEAYRFPDRKHVNELVRFNRAYRKHLETRQQFEFDRTGLFMEAIQETDQLYQVWDAVRDSRCDFYYIMVRRQALQRLKEMLGNEAYQMAELPPHVPVWRFNDLD
jgi:hypothetical protein